VTMPTWAMLGRLKQASSLGCRSDHTTPTEGVVWPRLMRYQRA